MRAHHVLLTKLRVLHALSQFKFIRWSYEVPWWMLKQRLGEAATLESGRTGLPDPSSD